MFWLYHWPPTFLVFFLYQEQLFWSCLSVVWLAAVSIVIRSSSRLGHKGLSQTHRRTEPCLTVINVYSRSTQNIHGPPRANPILHSLSLKKWVCISDQYWWWVKCTGNLSARLLLLVCWKLHRGRTLSGVKVDMLFNEYGFSSSVTTTNTSS